MKVLLHSNYKQKNLAYLLKFSANESIVLVHFMCSLYVVDFANLEQILVTLMASCWIP